jgi:hypothetical protein
VLDLVFVLNFDFWDIEIYLLFGACYLVLVIWCLLFGASFGACYLPARRSALT